MSGRAAPEGAGAPGAVPFGCIILGAGAGVRFGEPKAGAELRPGRRFIDEVVGAAAASGADPIIAVVPPGLEVPAPARPAVTDRGAVGGEQMESVRIGLARLANTSVAGALLWPVDHPFASVGTVLALVDAHRRTGAAVTVPTHDGRRGHPVFFARESWGSLMSVEPGAGGARVVVRTYERQGGVHEVRVSDPGVLRDIDTRADLRGGAARRGDAVP